MASDDQPRDVGRQPVRLVAPAKALRLRGALRAGVGELDRVALDDVARRRMITAHRAAIVEVASTVSDAIIDQDGTWPAVLENGVVP